MREKENRKKSSHDHNLCRLFVIYDNCNREGFPIDRGDFLVYLSIYLI